MAEAFTILSNLKAEVEGRIEDITPTFEPEIRFVKFDESVARKNDILEDAGRARQFRIGEPFYREATNLYFIGTSSEWPSFNLPIWIVYPSDDPEWRLAALDDANLIRSDIFNNRENEPSGVEARWIDNLEPTFEQSDDDPWEVMELLLFTQLNVTR